MLGIILQRLLSALLLKVSEAQFEKLYSEHSPLLSAKPIARCTKGKENSKVVLKHNDEDDTNSRNVLSSSFMHTCQQNGQACCCHNKPSSKLRNF